MKISLLTIFLSTIFLFASKHYIIFPKWDYTNSTDKPILSASCNLKRSDSYLTVSEPDTTIELVLGCASNKPFRRFSYRCFNPDSEHLVYMGRIYDECGIINAPQLYLSADFGQFAVTGADTLGNVYVILNKDWVNSDSDCAVKAILLHEIGHPMNQHLTRRNVKTLSRSDELQADYYAGFHMYSTLLDNESDSNCIVHMYNKMPEDLDHPGPDKRLDTLWQGWGKAKKRDAAKVSLSTQLQNRKGTNKKKAQIADLLKDSVKLIYSAGPYKKPGYKAYTKFTHRIFCNVYSISTTIRKDDFISSIRYVEYKFDEDAGFKPIRSDNINNDNFGYVFLCYRGFSIKTKVHFKDGSNYSFISTFPLN